MRLNFGGDATQLIRRRLWILALAALAALTPRTASAALTTVGDVTPAIAPTGGNVAGPLRVGNTLFGSLTIAPTATGPGGPAINVTGSSTTVGDGAAGVGLITLQGFGSNLTTANDLIIGNNGTGSVAMSSTSRITTADDLILAVANGSSGDLFVDDQGTIVDVADAAVVGQAGTALVQITGGGKVTADDTVLGQLATGDGRIVVSQHASVWQQTSTMTIGDAGRGDLQVLTQGRVDTASATMGNAATGTGLALVNGTGSVWDVDGFITIGVQGNATMRVFDGGRVANSTTGRLATTAGSEGHVTVSGLSSLWTVGTTVTVGENGFGTVDIAAGGRVTSGNVVLGDNLGARGEVVVDGNDSKWAITGTLDVSEPGEALLTISNSGLVTTTGVTRVAPAGRLVMDGGRLDIGAVGGLTNQGLVQGGGRINGAVTNTAGGKVRVGTGDYLLMSSTLTNSGVVDVAGGELEVLGFTSNSLDIDARDATLRFNAGLTTLAVGQLALTGGNVDVFGAVTNASGGQLVVGAEAHGVFHDAVTNNGQLFVMPGANVLALENLTFGGASLLALRLGGDDAQEEVAQVEVAGTATLSGNLQVNLANGFAPKLGDSFQVVTAAGGLSGMFADEALPVLANGLTWAVDYSAQSLTLSVVPGFSADFNNDGSVDAGDLAIFQSGFGTSTGADASDGDADGDNDVDGRDFLTWQQQNGADPAASPAASAVPEPACGRLLAIAAAALVWRRRTGR